MMQVEVQVIGSIDRRDNNSTQVNMDSYVRYSTGHRPIESSLFADLERLYNKMKEIIVK